uniref:Cystatin fetuin-B-type domain-containing protein n=1 Tax=Myotis myotis TaxID=51298 RepID=A0A7J7ZXR3_MYOMY|nr:hypothetical protein mMyoMyo1_009936 [Myotis myotis]
MGLFRLLVLCTLAVSCTTTSMPLKIPSHLPFHLRGCNDTDMLAMAASVLQDINNDLKEGYVLSLNRVSAVQEHRQDGLGSLFYFTLDVLHTTCHVLSKKPWRDCEWRHLHEQVYGKCKALYYVNRPLRILYLPAYNCTLRPVSRRKIQRMCPDCPSPANLSDPKVLETATETLAKFNENSKSGQYSLVKVTRASSQWVFGPFYFVEYLIKESPCIKTEASSSGYQPTDSGPVGICRGSLRPSVDDKKIANVNCDFFQSQKNESTHSPSKDVLSGSVQYLPDLDDEESQEMDPAECPGKASMSNPILLPP